MTLSGNLSEYSIAEIFNFIHEGSRTGLLEISPGIQDVYPPSEARFVWFESGRVIAATTGSDGKELLLKIEERKFMSLTHIAVIANQLHQLPQPLGIYLKSRGFLDAEQLKLLFNSQTIAAICKLFELKNRQFCFDLTRSPSNSELTGISLPAQEVGMLGLRVLKDWSGLSAKLPAADYAIQRLSTQQPSFRLDRHELQLWKLADGETTLAQLAKKMDTPIDIIRQVSFRLSSFRLIQEIPSNPIAPIDEDLSMSLPVSALEIGTKNPPVSSSFLGNLKNFLKKGSNKSARSLTK